MEYPTYVPVTEILIDYVGEKNVFGIVPKTKESIFIPYNCRRAVIDAGTKKVRFSPDNVNYPLYRVRRGDTIIAHIVPGDVKRRKAGQWAPKCVWKNTGEPELLAEKPQFTRAFERETDYLPKKPINQRPQVVNLLERSDTTHLKKLDLREDHNVVIRVFDRTRTQIAKGYGPLHKMMSRDSETIHVFADRDNTVEALLHGKWVRVQNPFISDLQAIA